MKIIKSRIPEVCILQPKKSTSDCLPGQIRETFSVRSLQAYGINVTFLSEAEIRFPYSDMLSGMYYELCPNQQAKLISCKRGSVIVGVTDIRADSPSFGQSNVISVSEENERVVLVPRGFAFGILTCSENVVVQLRFENKWNPKNEKVFNALDKEAGLQWNNVDYIMTSTQRYAPMLFDVRYEVFEIEKERLSEEYRRISGNPLNQEEELPEMVEEPLVDESETVFEKN